MRIDRIELHAIVQPLVHPFRTSFGVETMRPCILAAVYSDGVVGWGECTADHGPFYSGETITTAWHIMHDFLAPALLGQTLTEPADIKAIFHPFRGHPMAKAGLENAVWDLHAQQTGRSLSNVLGGARDRVPVGVSIGIQPSIDKLIDRIASFVDQGYGRIKVKIEPGWELAPLKRIRERFPDVMLMADANSAFTLDDIDLFRAMDDFDLLMIEQPLSYDDIADHARLQAAIKTSICLDESIHSPANAQAAIDLNACRIINMKVARVGGLGNAVTIHDMCAAAGVQLWCGGMLETGVGRATNIHLASMANFTLPGDISGTDRYYDEDIASPRFELNREDSTMSVPAGAGIGVTVHADRVVKYRQQHAVFTA